MKTPRTLRIALAALLAAVLGAPAALAAEVSLERLGGGEALTETMLARGAVVVVVWTSWARGGGDIVERINRIDERWRSKALVVSVVFQEDARTVRQFLEGRELKVPVYLDAGNAEFSKRHNVTRVPRLLVFKDGVPAINVNLPDDPDPVIAGAIG